MAKKTDRFFRTMDEGSTISGIGKRSIMVDRVTGVNYLLVAYSSGVAMTPLLDSFGRVVVTPPEYLP